MTDGDALGCVQIWAVNTAGQLELTFSHPEEESQADSRNVSVGPVFRGYERLDDLVWGPGSRTCD